MRSNPGVKRSAKQRSRCLVAVARCAPAPAYTERWASTKTRLLLLPFIVLFPVVGLADGFSCSVNEVYSLADSGAMRRDKSYESLLSGRRFSVDRTRGVITGYPLDNSSATEIRVLSLGNEASSFKVLSIRANDDPYYLRIDVFRAGSDIPFVGFKGEEVFSGVCRPL